MEIEMEEIIVDEELEIEDIELDVIKEYSGEGTSDYKRLKNKPQINGIELVGNKTTKDLGIEVGKEVHIGAEEPTGEETIWIDTTEEADKIPTKLSELENDSGFITEIPEEYAKKTDIPDVSNLAKKSDIPSIEGLATEEYVNNIVGDIETMLGGI